MKLIKKFISLQSYFIWTDVRQIQKSWQQCKNGSKQKNLDSVVIFYIQQNRNCSQAESINTLPSAVELYSIFKIYYWPQKVISISNSKFIRSGVESNDYSKIITIIMLTDVSSFHFSYRQNVICKMQNFHSKTGFDEVKNLNLRNYFDKRENDVNIGYLNQKKIFK